MDAARVHRNLWITLRHAGELAERRVVPYIASRACDVMTFVCVSPSTTLIQKSSNP